MVFYITSIYLFFPLLKEDTLQLLHYKSNKCLYNSEFDHYFFRLQLKIKLKEFSPRYWSLTSFKLKFINFFGTILYKSSFIHLPKRRKLFTFLKSPFVNKNSRDQVDIRTYNAFFLLQFRRFSTKKHKQLFNFLESFILSRNSLFNLKERNIFKVFKNYRIILQHSLRLPLRKFNTYYFRTSNSYFLENAPSIFWECCGRSINVMDTDFIWIFKYQTIWNTFFWNTNIFYLSIWGNNISDFLNDFK